MLTKIYKKAPCLCAAGITAASFLMSQVILGVIGGDMTLFYGDLFIQYIPFIKMFLRALKGQESFWYSFSLFAGSPMAATYMHCCMSPFNLLYLIPGISMVTMSLVISILKAGCAAASFAYFAGRALGKHKLAPVLSPKKSVEGSVGGVLGALLLGALYAYLISLPIVETALICAFTSIISQFGDLFASAIKRNHEIKDYGNLIPGHGGILDRFDSVIITAPFIYVLCEVIL